MAKFSQAIKAIAINLQESFDMREASQMHGNVQKALSQAISDGHRDTGNYGYYVDHSGDGMSGDVIYQSGGRLKKAPYSGTKAEGKSTWAVSMDKAKNVTSVVSYKEAGLASVVEVLQTPSRSLDMKTLNALRDSGILTEAQVQEVVSASEHGTSVASVNRGTVGEAPLLKLTESTNWGDELVLIEAAGVEREIKLIKAGAGASAFYPAEILKRDGPKVFTKKTQMFINHATAAEEAERPVGDWHKLVGALSTDAYWKESGKHGEGLYAMAKFASNVAPSIIEKAPYSGLSIRASGIAEAGQKKDGLPVLKQLISAESVDVVTKAGAGGMILTEAATGPNKGDKEMTEAEIKALVEAGVTARLAQHADANVTKLLERARKGDATVIATRVLAQVSLVEASKQRVIETVVAGNLPLSATGEIDEAKFTELVNAEAKREGAYVAQLTGSGRVLGMGSAPVQPTPEEAKRLQEEQKAIDEDAVQVFQAFGMTEAQAKAAAGKAA